MRLLSLIIISLLGMTSLQGLVWQGSGPEGFSVQITVPDQKLPIASRFNVVLELTHPSNYEVDLQTVRANLLRNSTPKENPFILISQVQETKPQEDTKFSFSRITFKMEPLQVGHQVITPMNIPFLSKSGSDPKRVEIVADIFPIEIVLPSNQTILNPNILASPLLDFGDNFPIALDFDLLVKLKGNPEQLEKEARKNAALIKSKHIPWNALGGILGIFLIWAIYKNAPRKKESIQEAKKSEIAFQEAVEKLHELEQEQASDPNLADDYFVQLSHAVRYRIEEQFGLKAPFQTSQEFLRSLESHPIFDEQTRGLLHDFLENTDRVKFAQHHPTLEECRLAEQSAREFLDKA